MAFNLHKAVNTSLDQLGKTSDWQIKTQICYYLITKLHPLLLATDTAMKHKIGSIPVAFLRGSRQIVPEMYKTRQTSFLVLLALGALLFLVQIGVLDLSQPTALWRKATFAQRTKQVRNSKVGK